MLAALRHHLLQRLLAALLAMALVLVAGAAHACRLTQALHTMGTADTVLVDGHARLHGEADAYETSSTAHRATDCLRHGGPCHLLAVTAMPGDALEPGFLEPAVHRPDAGALWFASCDWPPPRHRPRAG